MDRDRRQAESLQRLGAVTPEHLNAAFQAPRDPRVHDLCAVLLQWRLISPELAALVRSQSGAQAGDLHLATRVDSSTAEGLRVPSDLQRSHGSFSPPLPQTAAHSPYPSVGAGQTPYQGATPAPGSNPLSQASRGSPSTSELPRVLGGCEIIKELGRGGMGVVFLARHIDSGRQVALKVLTRADKKAFDRFEIEVEAAAAIRHQNIVEVLGAGTQDGFAFMIMAYVEGESLDRYLKRRGSVPPDQAAEWMRDLADALQLAHESGILHRDLKPSNIIVDRSEPPQPFLMDFGLAKLTDARVEALTVTGEMIGTPQYMSPEQAEGKRDKVDARSDVYSLGATLYELLCGRPPFEAAAMIDLMIAISMTAPKSLRSRRPDLPVEIEAIVMKALAKSPDARYQSAAEFAEDLDRFLLGEEVHAPLVSHARAGRGITWMFIFVIFVGLLSGGAWLLTQSQPPSIDPRPIPPTPTPNPDPKPTPPEPGPPPPAPDSSCRVQAEFDPTDARVLLVAAEDSRLRFELRHKDSIELRPGLYKIQSANPKYRLKADSRADLDLKVGPPMQLHLAFEAISEKATIQLTEKGPISLLAWAPGAKDSALLLDQPGAAEVQAGDWRFELRQPDRLRRRFRRHLKAGENYPILGHLSNHHSFGVTIRPKPVRDVLVSDFDGDGMLELAYVQEPGTIVNLRSDGSFRLVEVDFPIRSSLANFDMNADGLADIAFQRDTGAIYAWLGGKDKEIFQVNGIVAAGPFLGVDLDADGKNELVFRDKESHLLIARSGQLGNMKIVQTLKGEGPPAIAGDFFPHPGLEVFSIDKEGAYRLISASGEILWDSRLPGRVLSLNQGEYNLESRGPEVIVGLIANEPASPETKGSLARMTCGAREVAILNIPTQPLQLQTLRRSPGQADLAVLQIDDFSIQIIDFVASSIFNTTRIGDGDRLLAVQSAELNGEPGDELVISTQKGFAAVLDSKLATLWSTGLGGKPSALALEDLNRDSRAELIFGLESGEIQVLFSDYGDFDTQLPYTGDGSLRAVNAIGANILGPGTALLDCKELSVKRLVAERGDKGDISPFPFHFEPISKSYLVTLPRKIAVWNPYDRSPIGTVFEGDLVMSMGQMGSTLLTGSGLRHASSLSAWRGRA